MVQERSQVKHGWWENVVHLCPYGCQGSWVCGSIKEDVVSRTDKHLKYLMNRMKKKNGILLYSKLGRNHHDLTMPKKKKNPKKPKSVNHDNPNRPTHYKDEKRQQQSKCKIKTTALLRNSKCFCHSMTFRHRRRKFVTEMVAFPQ